MPSYDILCDECGFLEDRRIKISETDNLEPCSKCGSEHVRIAILSAPRTIFKGGGWFNTDGDYHKPNTAKGSRISKKDIAEYERSGKVRA